GMRSRPLGPHGTTSEPRPASRAGIRRPLVMLLRTRATRPPGTRRETPPARPGTREGTRLTAPATDETVRPALATLSAMPPRMPARPAMRRRAPARRPCAGARTGRRVRSRAVAVRTGLRAGPDRRPPLPASLTAPAESPPGTGESTSLDLLAMRRRRRVDHRPDRPPDSR